VSKKKSRAVRHLQILAAVLCTCAATISACAGGMPKDAVVMVDGSPITKATLDHWTLVEFATDYDQKGQEPIPQGVIPDPPSYTACVAYLKRTRQVEIGNPHRSFAPSSLKRECAQHDRQVREHVQNVLIVFEWHLKSAAEDGIKFSDEQVRERYAQFSKARFPHQGELQRYLANTGQSLNDELLRMKIDMVGTKLNDNEIARLGGLKTTAQRQGFERWSEQATKRWLGKTECRKGYVVENCKQYKGPLGPDTRI